MKKSMRMLATALTTMTLFWGCGSDSDSDETSGGDSINSSGGNSSSAGGESSVNEMGEAGEAGTADNTNQVGNGTAENCLFDEAEAGKGPGKQIEDFPLEMWNGERFDFHNNCGGDRKAIWVFLSTGWCGACENYARTAQGFYEEFNEQGLEIVWIVGEDQNHEPPTPEYMAQYKEAKMANFTIIRDNNFYQTRRFIDPNAAGNILPRQYVIDASNMEMVYAGGRPFERGECEMKRLLGEIDVESCEGVGE